jgi:hypothetical protein
MKAVEVFINDHRVCLAGVGDDGVLNTMVNWVGGPGRGDDCLLSIGGLDCRTDEHLRWNVPSIGVGAEVLVRLLETSIIDPPDERERHEKQACVDQYRQHLRECSGWLTPDERTQLLKELVAELKALDAEQAAPPDPAA